MEEQDSLQHRMLGEDDITDIVAVHTAAFRTSVITRLGSGAVMRYYRWLLCGPHDSRARGVFNNGRLVGYCVEGEFRDATSGYLKRNACYLVFCVSCRPWLLLHAEVIQRILLGIRIMRHHAAKKTTNANSSIDSVRRRSYGVLSIATDPHYRVTGAGTLMLREAESAARTLGYRHMQLTVHPDNTRAVAFYERNGWTRVLRYGAWEGHMSKDLDNA